MEKRGGWVGCYLHSSCGGGVQVTPPGEGGGLPLLSLFFHGPGAFFTSGGRGGPSPLFVPFLPLLCPPFVSPYSFPPPCPPSPCFFFPSFFWKPVFALSVLGSFGVFFVSPFPGSLPLVSLPSPPCAFSLSPSPWGPARGCGGGGGGVRRVRPCGRPRKS